MTILTAASEWYLPHWIPSFWHAVREYQVYTGAISVLDSLIGTPWSRALELLAFAAMMGVCWRERRQGASTGSFAFTLSLVLATTILLVPTSSPNNQVLLIPALLVLANERRTIWRRGIANRVLFAITAGRFSGRGSRAQPWRACPSFCRSRRSSEPGQFLSGRSSRSRLEWLP